MLDEGGAIVTGVIPGIERPVALVGIAEKGYISLELSCDSPGGHSSAPPAVTAIGRLSRAVHRLETHPMPARLASVRRLFSRLASDLPYPMRIGLANLWLFGGIVQRRLSATPSTNAMIRTTTALSLILLNELMLLKMLLPPGDKSAQLGTIQHGPGRTSYGEN